MRSRILLCKAASDIPAAFRLLGIRRGLRDHMVKEIIPSPAVARKKADCKICQPAVAFSGYAPKIARYSGITPAFLSFTAAR